MIRQRTLLYCVFAFKNNEGVCPVSVQADEVKGAAEIL